jgi:hypothetical protein
VENFDSAGLSGPLTLAIGTGVVTVLMALVAFAILSSRRLDGSSLFNRLFIVVAATSSFFSAVSSAIGFSLITSQESDDFFRNALLPPAFGFFVFFLAVAIWIGGAELVRHRDWFRNMEEGPLATALHFAERCVKIFIVVPLLSVILFFVSTWTTVVGIGGVDAVRYAYAGELLRLQTECARLSQWRQRDLLFLEDLRLSVAGAENAARRERDGGFQTGSAGRGAVTDYIAGVADWYRDVAESVSGTLSAPDPSGLDPYDPETCPAALQSLRGKLSADAYSNYDAWARDFEASFDDLAAALNRWRQDRRIERLLEAQLAGFERTNPRPVGAVSSAQSAAIDAYSKSVTDALRSFIRKQKSAKPPEPLASAAEKSPTRGLEIVADLLRAKPVDGDLTAATKKRPRTAAVIENERIASLSTITPRDAVLKYAQPFSDVWALGIAWDYASYILMLAFLFFPSAERAAGRKDD